MLSYIQHHSLVCSFNHLQNPVTLGFRDLYFLLFSHSHLLLALNFIWREYCSIRCRPPHINIFTLYGAVALKHTLQKRKKNRSHTGIVSRRRNKAETLLTLVNMIQQLQPGYCGTFDQLIILIWTHQLHLLIHLSHLVILSRNVLFGAAASFKSALPFLIKQIIFHLNNS